MINPLESPSLVVQRWEAGTTGSFQAFEDLTLRQVAFTAWQFGGGTPGQPFYSILSTDPDIALRPDLLPVAGAGNFELSFAHQSVEVSTIIFQGLVIPIVKSTTLYWLSQAQYLMVQLILS